MLIFETHAHFDDERFKPDCPKTSHARSSAPTPAIIPPSSVDDAPTSTPSDDEILSGSGNRISHMEVLDSLAPTELPGPEATGAGEDSGTQKGSDGKSQADGSAKKGSGESEILPDRHELLASMPSCGIGPLINVGASMDSSRESLALAELYPHVYAALGVHPSDIDTIDEEGLAWMRKHAGNPKVAAIGEIGLDYYWEKDEAVRAEQREWFKRQAQLAREVDLPVIIHSRDACEDTLTILREEIAKGTRGVMHCFSYSPEVAQEYVKMGFYIGIGGVVTFKNGKKMKETVKEIPLSRILVETDSPYLAPEPFRGKRNDSTYLPYIVQAIAKLLEITEDEVIGATAENARRLFTKATWRG